MRWVFVVLATVLSGCVPQVQALFTPPLAPRAAALAALESTPAVRVEATSYGYALLPEGQPKGGFAFYPGGRVDFRAYAPVLQRVAAAGYRVALLEVPLSLAILAQDRANAPLAAHPELRWAVGGHSLGGVAAANFAAGNPAVRGLVLYASFPQNNLSSRSLPTLALFGGRDGLIPPDERSRESSKLPQGSLVEVLEGLNHAGFGDYGPQPEDLPATLETTLGWNQIAQATLRFLDRVLAAP